MLATSIGVQPSGERLRGKSKHGVICRLNCDPCLSALKWFIYHAIALLINSQLISQYSSVPAKGP